MKKEKCIECENFIPHYIIHPILGLRKTSCGCCKLYKDSIIKKLTTCNDYKKIENEHYLQESYFALLLNFKKELAKMNIAITKLEKDFNKQNFKQ